jgi:tetratricopeptide (TPR) repeat protein
MRARSATRQQRVEIDFLEGVARRLPGRGPVLRALADLYTAAGRIEDGYRLDLKITALDPTDGTAWYNLACSHALLGRPADALDSLRQAVRTGYNEARWMRADPDLASLRGHPEFHAILASLPPEPAEDLDDSDLPF